MSPKLLGWIGAKLRRIYPVKHDIDPLGSLLRDAVQLREMAMCQNREATERFTRALDAVLQDLPAAS